MTACCHNSAACVATDKFFSKWSKKYAKRFRKTGLEKTQEYLLEGIRKEPVVSKRLLDIGCGVGSLHLTLLREGAAAVVGVDMSNGMLEQAKKLAGENHLEGRAEYILGDFVTESKAIQEADITMLDKVVCCYEDYRTLINASTSKTKAIYALSHPKDSLIMRCIFTLQILVLKLFRSSFHPFWHNWNDVQEAIIDQGFHLLYSNSTIAWQVLVYKRTISSPLIVSKL